MLEADPEETETCWKLVSLIGRFCKWKVFGYSIVPVFEQHALPLQFCHNTGRGEWMKREKGRCLVLSAKDRSGGRMRNKSYRKIFLVNSSYHLHQALVVLVCLPSVIVLG